MAYIGRQNLGGAYRQLDDISSSFDGSDTTHTMQVNSQNVTVGDVNQIILSLGGVIQNPGTDFTVSGSVLTFTTAPAANTTFFAILLGSDNGGTTTPTDGSVTTTKIVDDAVTAAKVASSGAFAIGAAGTASSLAGITFFQGDTGSIYTHDVSGTDSTATYNTAYGLTALDAITTGDYNTTLGYAAGTDMTTGNSNNLIGYLAGENIVDGAHNTFIGRQAGRGTTSASTQVFIGGSAGEANTTGSDNIAIGYAAYQSSDTETNNLAIGKTALGGSVAGGEENVAVGNYTLDALTSADYNTAVGYFAGSGVTTGGLNTMIGWYSGRSITEGVDNVTVGREAGQAITTGDYNTLVGGSAGKAFDTENYNVGFGYEALRSGSLAGAEYNVAIGSFTLDAITSGDNNIAVGHNAGTAITTSSMNTIVGDAAGGYLTTGDGRNTIIGKDCFTSGTSLTTGNNSIALGERCKMSAADGNFQFVIGSNVTSNGNSTTTIGYDTTEIATNHGSASWAAVSDQRYKKDIEDSTAGLSFINDLRPVTFKFKQKNELDTDLFGYDANSTDTDGYTDEIAHGFIAQEIKTAIDNHPEIKAGQEIWKEAPEIKGKRQNVSHIGMIPMLVKAVQELSTKVKALEDA